MSTQYSQQEKLDIVLAILRKKVQEADLCRQRDIDPETLKSWINLFLQGGKNALSVQAPLPADVEAIALRIENERLRRELGKKQMIVHEVLQELTFEFRSVVCAIAMNSELLSRGTRSAKRSSAQSFFLQSSSRPPMTIPTA